MLFTTAGAFSPERPQALQEATLRPGKKGEAMEAPGKSLLFSRPAFPPLEQRLPTEPECRDFTIPNPELAQGLALGRC